LGCLALFFLQLHSFCACNLFVSFVRLINLKPFTMRNGVHIAEKGGRIKAAAESFKSFPRDPHECYRYIQEQRKKPDFKFLQAFFPLPHGEMRQHLNRLGLYRSTFKTDQGMPGNFSVFYVDPAHRETTECIFFEGEEGLAIPEPYADLDGDLVAQVQEAFLSLDLAKTSALIEDLPRREALKGRQPFFFVRAAVPKQRPVIGADILGSVRDSAKGSLAEAIERAKAYASGKGATLQPNVIYLQPDIMVTVANGRTFKTEIDQLHAPDVGMFFSSLEDIQGSRMLGTAQDVIEGISEDFIESARNHLGSFDRVFIATRNEVLVEKSDVLELGDIEVLKQALEREGKRVRVIPVSALDSVESDDAVLLMNVNYGDEETKTNIYNARLKSGAPTFFPDPFLQEELRLHTGLQSVVIDKRFREKFVDLVGSAPEKQVGIENKIQAIRDMLARAGITSDTIRCRIANETVVIPVQASQAWLALAARIKQYPNDTPIHIDAITLNEHNGLVYDAQGDPRMHVFRFGMTVDPE
jgi:hypothetical protein